MKCYSPISDLEVYTYAFQPIDSRMYVILDLNVNGKAIVIDPCVSEEAYSLLVQHGIKELTVILTHEHYDHISGVNWLKDLFPCEVIANKVCSRVICDPVKNRSKYFPALFVFHPTEVQNQIREMNIQPYCCEADVTFEDDDTFSFGNHTVFMRTTPGHSPSSICIILDNACLFSGDTLLRTQPILRKPEGDKTIYFEETIPWLQTLDHGMQVYPGHGDAGKFTEMYFVFGRG